MARKQLIAFDLDGTLAESKQPIDTGIGDALSRLLGVYHVAIISGGDWPQFEKQVISRLPAHAATSRLWMLPTSGTKLYVHHDGAWVARYADLFTADEKQSILTALDEAVRANGLIPDRTWGEQIEDRGSQITFSALGQMAPVDAKARWDPDFSRRRLLQADLQRRLPGHAVNMGGATSVDVTRAGIDKAYGMRRLCAESAIAPDAMLFIGDALFPGGNDYPVKAMGIDTVAVRGPHETRTVIASLLASDPAEHPF